MGARGNFRHDTAIGRVILDLAQDFIRENAAPPINPRSTTEAAVSSQVVSIPRIRMTQAFNAPIAGQNEPL